jgi:hypothetical protein
MRRLILISLLAASLCSFPSWASFGAEPAVRELTCVAEDGSTTTFTGQQVRQGATPAIWRSVDPGDPAGFVSLGITMTDPNTGQVIVVSDHIQGVDRHFALTTCSFIIPVGPNAGWIVEFEGYFVPVH